ncbi:GFA family protein [Albimonas sp. CAU 1670]|uniref:GFA family protein n=1 Tax=Albimonas sp. CAU 1670 TaxID=3032599 RepID=UPI0023DACA60|nr:GFA family protein [Albimonas sp. CAU 1670]MDF2234670.1 GFA family protein [Albimonas sp. CAU 1670]
MSDPAAPAPAPAADADASGWRLPWAGGCRCGALRFAVTAPPMLSAACHCRGCQRMTGSAFSLTLMLPEAGFALTQGSSIRGGLGGALERGCAGATGLAEAEAAEQGGDGLPPSGIDHRICPACGSWVFTRIAAFGGLVNLRATMLDDAGWTVPFLETMRADALPWAGTPAPHRHDRFPGPEAFPALLAAYAAEGARPGRPG